MGRFFFQIMVPIVFCTFTVFYSIILVGLRTARVSGTNVSAVTVLFRLFSSLVPVMYIPVCKIALEYFDCTKLADGTYYLDVSLDVKCFEGEWNTWVPVAIGAGVIYVFVLPLLTGVALYANRTRLEQVPVLARFGPLFQSYRPEYYAYELVQLGKRLAIVSAALFFSSLAIWLFISLSLSFLVAHIIHVKTMPIVLFGSFALLIETAITEIRMYVAVLPRGSIRPS